MLAERARARSATWETLRELNDVLQARHEMLGQLLQRSHERYAAASRAHDDEIAVAQRRLDKERRALMRAVPATAAGHLADLVNAEDSVRAAARRLAVAERAINETAKAQRDVMAARSAVAQRQRAAFAALLS